MIVVDANNGHVLYERNADKRHAVGSTQKLLTALIVVDHDNLDQKVTIQPIDEKTEPSMLRVRPGESYTRRDLLNAMLTKSANDVARVFARDQAGSFPAFSEEMNEYATKLGLTHSHFITPNGLPAKGQYATARDMARIGLAAYHNPTLREMVAQKYYTFYHAHGRAEQIKNTNFALHQLPFCNGLKTGYTRQSRHCLISSGSYEGRDVVVVILGSSKNIFRDSEKLLAWSLGAPLPVIPQPHRKVAHRRVRRVKRVHKTPRKFSKIDTAPKEPQS